MAKGLLPEAQQPCLTMRTIGVAHTATRTAIQSSSEAERAEGVAPCVEYVDWARQREQRVNVGVLDLTSSMCVGRREAGYRNREKQLALHRKKARRAVSHRRTPTGEPCSVRGGNGRFDYNRNRAFERRARSAPNGAPLIRRPTRAPQLWAPSRPAAASAGVGGRRAPMWARQPRVRYRTRNI
jgi:hypothetical protein